MNNIEEVRSQRTPQKRLMTIIKQQVKRATHDYVVLNDDVLQSIIDASKIFGIDIDFTPDENKHNLTIRTLKR